MFQSGEGLLTVATAERETLGISKSLYTMVQQFQLNGKLSTVSLVLLRYVLLRSNFQIEVKFF